jgi:hypothetical protein
VVIRTIRHPTPAVPSVAPRRHVQDEHRLVRMQRLAGNAAVVAAVQRDAVVQRNNGKGGHPRTDPPGP